MFLFEFPNINTDEQTLQGVVGLEESQIQSRMVESNGSLSPQYYSEDGNMYQNCWDPPSSLVGESISRNQKLMRRLGGHIRGNRTKKSYEVGKDSSCK